MHYQVMRDGQSYGPYTIEDLRRYVVTGNVQPTDLAKSDEMAEWTPVAQLLSEQAPPPPAVANTGFIQPLFPYHTASSGAAGSVGYPAAGPRLYPYFPVPTSKFIIMFLVTFGLYQVYWAYKQWSRIAERTGEPMMLWARAFFLGIWDFVLFSRIKDEAIADNSPVTWKPVALGIAVLVIAITSRLPGAWGGLVFLGFLPYLPVLKTIQAVNRKHADMVEEPPNTRYTAWNITGLVLGGLMLGLALLGLALQAAHLA